ncbi:MAG: cyclic pyranopterin monophosphate synthase MoaC [Armatimonadota bacterium]|nr:cyclic pyranopterin monophosphate synthase MoaC [Armatimonadota bacterium]MDR7518936.1 cyclic pyranopterin monophosphate synthase MoaC [Armatimonadota bacterium]MDR7550620.1 cyclic pyranopterin monophosphate synthase MoaC [Armatimonadota bacterium]
MTRRRKTLTHTDRAGRARMVDVSAKPATVRVATARGLVRMQPQTLAQVAANQVKKGDVLTVAQVAGVVAAKRTAELIPLCHPVALTDVQVRAEPDAAAGGVTIEATARTTAPTGVEMEALVAVAVAALTVYDMCKAADRGMTIDRIRLVHKRGGRSGTYRRPGEVR